MTKIAMLWIEEEKLSRLKRKWKEEKRSQLWNSDLAPPNAVLCPLGGLDTKGLIWPDQCPQFSQKCEAQWDWYDRNKIGLIFQMSSELLFASPEDDVPEVLLDTWYSRMCPRCTIWDSQNLSVCARYQMKKVWLWKHLSQGWGRDNGFLVCSLMGWLTIWCCCAPGRQPRSMECFHGEILVEYTGNWVNEIGTGWIILCCCNIRQSIINEF